jgi:hypothetical protein
MQATQQGPLPIVSAQITRAQREALLERARRDGRSLSAELRAAIDRHLARAGDGTDEPVRRLQPR